MSVMDLIEKGKRARRRKQREKALKTAAIGAAVGVTVGAVAGVLLAPKSGKETREDLANAAKELPGKAKEALEQAKGKVEAVKKEIAERRQGKGAIEAEATDKTAYDE